ncbi:hypothetical protein EDB81DRAFT_878821 [Dactylonectria macrodidyma]|uniref:Uncharacterized protein n=1 Tax=Dactylonectria macrodidyma TaxID=307937 RepID=A0A9P9JNF5_9HYPO|nr:hypothetical protein EDB81DRAFT_878821 [Dactylonectria macrodidyma]
MAPRAPAPEVVLIIAFDCLAIAAGAIIARLYLRLAIQRRGLPVSDVLMRAAWVAGLANTCLLIIYLNLGALDPSVRFPFIFLPGGLEAFEKLLKVGFSPCWGAPFRNPTLANKLLRS